MCDVLKCIVHFSLALNVIVQVVVNYCCFVAVLSCGEAGAGPRLHKRYVGLYTGPYFDPSAPNNITTQLGTHAYLPCKVTTLAVALPAAGDVTLSRAV